MLFETLSRSKTLSGSKRIDAARRLEARPLGVQDASHSSPTRQFFYYFLKVTAPPLLQIGRLLH